MNAQGETGKTDQEMFAPTLDRNHFLICEPGLVNFAVSAYGKYFLPCEFPGFFFENNDGWTFRHFVENKNKSDAF